MRIAIVAPLVTPIAEPQLGGSQALLADIASGLAERGHDVDVFAATGSAIDGVRVVDTGVRPQDLAPTLFRADGSSDATAAFRAFARTYALVSAGVYDVVHNHAFDAPAMTLAADLAVPVVHTLHLPPMPEIADALRASSRAVIACVSDAQADAWSRHVSVDVVLRNGIPVTRIPWSEHAGEGALFAGRFSPEKGAREAVEIARRAGLTLVAVGSAYDEAYARRYLAGADVRSAMPRPELWKLMASMRVVLCPVQWEEPFGLVAAEAQATGTPVIAFRRGALPEVVEDGESGYLVDDVEGAVRALSVIDRIDRRACRRHAEHDLDLEATLHAHEELYERLVRAGVPT